MESIETELRVESAKSDRKGRQIRSTDEWAQILERYDTSGLTQEALSRREGIRYGTLVAWLGRRRKGSERLPSATALEVPRVEPDCPSTSQATLEVRLPDGTSEWFRRRGAGSVGLPATKLRSCSASRIKQRSIWRCTR